ncbi:hypothetical protein EVAR_6639_1 [Eumeta japonica]|uniref:Uncharacterized protein n=1 Tax=Eumeta variegata TaxID=151549 RepID=A0A4C1TKD2_EUMVA|nr:hypothetical protein EVAR_6639_1 [Eumeta japonica]
MGNFTFRVCVGRGGASADVVNAPVLRMTFDALSVVQRFCDASSGRRWNISDIPTLECPHHVFGMRARCPLRPPSGTGARRAGVTGRPRRHLPTPIITLIYITSTDCIEPYEKRRSFDCTI